MPIRTYVAIVRKRPRTNWLVDFPDFPALASSGRTREDAEQHARATLVAHLVELRRTRTRIPRPKPLEVILDDPEHEDGEPFWIAVDV